MTDVRAIHEFLHRDADHLPPVSTPAHGTLCFESSDNVVFHVDGARLRHNARSLPLTSFGEVTSLEEDAETLERLFRIVYQDKGIRPDTLPFEHLVLLADAAEKYQAYAASMMCRLAMKCVSRLVDVGV